MLQSKSFCCHPLYLVLPSFLTKGHFSVSFLFLWKWFRAWNGKFSFLVQLSSSATKTGPVVMFFVENFQDHTDFIFSFEYLIVNDVWIQHITKENLIMVIVRMKKNLIYWFSKSGTILFQFKVCGRRFIYFNYFLNDCLRCVYCKAVRVLSSSFQLDM